MNMSSFDRQFLAQKVRAPYIRELDDDLDRLLALDAKVKRPVRWLGFLWGLFSVAVMCAGICLCLTDIGARFGLISAWIPGAAIAVVGLGLALLTAPLCRNCLHRRRKKYATRILSISDRILNQ